MKDTGKISFFSAVLMSINIMIGAGILYSVGPMTSSAGSISFLGWPLIGLLLFPIIWSLAKASQLFPGEGGFYNYCSKGLNPTLGFTAHWGYLLGYMGTAASLATVLKEGLANNAGLTFIHEYPFLFNLTLVAFYTLINLISLTKISKIQSVATLLKITPIFIVITLLAFYFNLNLNFNVADIGNLGVTVSTVIFAYWGFESCCSISGLLKDGPQKVGSVILLAFFITMGLYGLFHLGLLFIMGPENLAAHGAIAFPSYLGLSPAWANALQIGISGAILLSWANSILGVSLANITNIYSFAKNKLILGDKMLTQVNKNERPIIAAFVHGAVLLAFITFISNVNILFSLTSLGIITPFIFTLAAVFKNLLKQTEKNYLHLVIVSLGFVSCGALIYYSAVKIPSFTYVLPLVIGMIAGLIMFKIQKSREAKPEMVLDA